MFFEPNLVRLGYLTNIGVKKSSLKILFSPDDDIDSKDYKVYFICMGIGSDIIDVKFINSLDMNDETLKSMLFKQEPISNKVQYLNKVKARVTKYKEDNNYGNPH